MWRPCRQWNSNDPPSNVSSSWSNWNRQTVSMYDVILDNHVTLTSFSMNDVILCEWRHSVWMTSFLIIKSLWRHSLWMTSFLIIKSLWRHSLWMTSEWDSKSVSSSKARHLHIKYDENFQKKKENELFYAVISSTYMYLLWFAQKFATILKDTSYSLVYQCLENIQFDE